jgi:type II secretion system protein G
MVALVCVPLFPFIAAAKTDVANLSTAVDAFATDTGRYPTEAEGLDVLVTQPTGLSAWNGPYLQQLKTDPSARPYVYHLGGPNGGPGVPHRFQGARRLGRHQ